MNKFELFIFVWLLKKYCNKELDQFDHWKISTKYGKVFVALSRYPEADSKEEHYIEL